jgi:hypothetical protein
MEDSIYFLLKKGKKEKKEKKKEILCLELLYHLVKCVIALKFLVDC